METNCKETQIAMHSAEKRRNKLHQKQSMPEKQSHKGQVIIYIVFAYSQN